MWRCGIHAQLRPLLSESSDVSGRWNCWDREMSRARADAILKHRQYMLNAHVHVIANMLGVPVVLVDQRGAVRILEFAPGWQCESEVTTERLPVLRRQGGVLWLWLSSGHFQALLPIAEAERQRAEESRLCAPLDLEQLAFPRAS